MTYRPITDLWILTRTKLLGDHKYYGAYLGGFPKRAAVAEARCKKAWELLTEIQDRTKAAEAFKAWERSKFGKEAKETELVAA